jgi:HPt (histidine-containing phosphotransfer) domain-containing protein
MAQGKIDKPSVATYATHEVITPSHKLRAALTTVPDTTDDDPVRRAERALAKLSPEFSGWMADEIERLDRTRQVVKEKGFDKGTREALFHAAHDIKGEAATFGYPAVAATADSLCRLIEHTPDMTRIPVTLVDQHVDAVRAIVRENAHPDVATIADALTRRLREVTEEFLAQENRDHPDDLESVLLGPPLAPGDSSF